MKPLTPRIRTRFMWRALYERPRWRAEPGLQRRCVDAFGIDLQRPHVQVASAAAAGDQPARLGGEPRRAGRRTGLQHAGFEGAGGMAGRGGARARVWRGARPHELVDRPRVALPAFAPAARWAPA